MITRRKLLVGAGTFLVLWPIRKAIPKPTESFVLPETYTFRDITMRLGNPEPVRPVNQRIYSWQYFSDEIEPCGCAYYQSIVCRPEEYHGPHRDEVLRMKFDIAEASTALAILKHRAPNYVHPRRWQEWDTDDQYES